MKNPHYTHLPQHATAVALATRTRFPARQRLNGVDRTPKDGLRNKKLDLPLNLPCWAEVFPQKVNYLRVCRTLYHLFHDELAGS